MPDGDLSKVRPQVLTEASDAEKWVAQRRARWPTKERIEQRKSEQPPEPKPVPGPTNPQPKRVPTCRHFARGSCKAGNKCKFAHVAPPSDRVYKRFEAPLKNSLFVKLMQQDLDKQDETVLDFILYLKARNLL